MKFLERFFKNKIERRARVLSLMERNAARLENLEKKAKLNFPIGTRVIVRSNEPDDLFIGTVVGYEVLDTSGQWMLHMHGDNKRNIYQLPDGVALWTMERERALRKLDWAEQWNVMSKFYDISDEQKAYKESAAYQGRNK